VPELTVGGLADGDARALLDAALAGPLDERVRDQIVAETQGNPLALLELPRGLTLAELAGGFGEPPGRLVFAVTGRGPGRRTAGSSRSGCRLRRGDRPGRGRS